MFWHQYAIMLVLLVYCLKAPSKGAFIILIGDLVYVALVIYDIPAETYIYYYSCTTLINLVVGYFLHKVNKLAALCSYTLVFVNIYGAYAWYQYLPPDLYDNISFIVLIVQLITITPRGLIDGFKRNRVYDKHTMVKSHGFDSFQSRVTMYKIPPETKVKK